VQRKQRDQLANATREDAFVANHVDLRTPEHCVELDTLVARRAEQEQLGEPVVEPTGCTTDDEQSTRLELERSIERKLEVTGVLLGGMTLERHTAALERSERLG